MLRDTLTHFSVPFPHRLCCAHVNQIKMMMSRLVWYYAPKSMDYEASQILQDLPTMRRPWDLIPMPETEGLTSSSLEKMLMHAVDSIVSAEL
jgi:hypothetical protein